MNKYLEKIADDTKNSVTTSNPFIAGEAFLGYKSLSGMPGRLAGYGKYYHGTTDSNAEAIRRQGFDPKKGGSGNAVVSDEFVRNSKGKVHLATNRFDANMYASNLGGVIHNRKEDDSHIDLIRRLIQERRKGGILEVNVPHTLMKDFEKDKNHPGARTTDQRIPTRYIKGSKDYGGVKQFLNKQHLKNYYGGTEWKSRLKGGVVPSIIGTALLADSGRRLYSQYGDKEGA